MSIIALIATRKGLFTLDKDLTLSLLNFQGEPVSMVLADNASGVWYAALDHGHFGVKLHRSDNRGESWREVQCPAYPKVEEPEKGETLKLIWSLEFAEKNHPLSLWAGTVPGGLFYSADGGESWELNKALHAFQTEQSWFGGGFDDAGIHSICVDPRDPAEVKIAISCAGVWVTRDKGKSWQLAAEGMRAAYMPPEKAYDPVIQDPHRMVQCRGNPDHFWVQHHNGIFFSKDNTNKWQEIEAVQPSAFGFACVVHPEDSQKAWFVPGVKDECRVPVNGKLIVNHTRDGGETFEAQSKGLPQDYSADLIFRHALDIDSGGNCLLMGSTTGNLWFSDNQGENWRCLSHYLPPVYAVRFL